ncbi:MAG: hypothetical protein ACYC9O_20205 [Candidatus Latescibacterota bacterium]
MKDSFPREIEPVSSFRFQLLDTSMMKPHPRFHFFYRLAGSDTLSRPIALSAKPVRVRINIIIFRVLSNRDGARFKTVLAEEPVLNMKKIIKIPMTERIVHYIFEPVCQLALLSGEMDGFGGF